MLRCWTCNGQYNEIQHYSSLLNAYSIHPFIPSTILPLRCPSGYSHNNMLDGEVTWLSRFACIIASSYHRWWIIVQKVSWNGGIASSVNPLVYPCVHATTSASQCVKCFCGGSHYDIIPACVSVCCPVSVSGISGCECGGWEHLVTRCFVVVVQCSLPGAALVDCPVNVLTGPSVLLRTLNSRVRVGCWWILEDCCYSWTWWNWSFYVQGLCWTILLVHAFLVISFLVINHATVTDWRWQTDSGIRFL